MPKTEVAPGLELDFTKGGMDIEVPIFELHMAAVRVPIKLVENDRAIFEADLGPELIWQVAVGKKLLFDVLAKELQAAGGDVDAAVESVSKEIRIEAIEAGVAENETFLYGLPDEQIAEIIHVATDEEFAPAMRTLLNNLRYGSPELAEMESVGVKLDILPEAVQEEVAAAEFFQALVEIECLVVDLDTGKIVLDVVEKAELCVIKP